MHPGPHSLWAPWVVPGVSCDDHLDRDDLVIRPPQFRRGTAPVHATRAPRMMTFTELPSGPSEHQVPFTDQLRLAVAASRASVATPIPGIVRSGLGRAIPGVESPWGE